MQILLFHTSMATTFIILLTPIFLTKDWNYTKTSKIACLTSLIPALIFMNTHPSSITTSINWTSSHLNLQASFLFDSYSTTFTPIAIFITSSILQFSNWYMKNEPSLKKFSKYLLFFLMAMLTLITSNNMFQLFIGWEGVGIMSFLLIGWWHSRLNANSAALQAIIYNRTGDIGLILALSWLAMTLNSWEMQQLFSHQHISPLPCLGLVLAAMGKSAQIGLHPWLPAAMEGPTPVSALLHSSTMVVAGVFLLIRLSPALQNSPIILTLCLFLGATTSTFAALCALTQNDIKKIIAFSTSSQLGLMMAAIGLNQPELAFLHISTHAFFKAMLFLCSGSIIHNLEDEQDIRKMGGLQKLLPITTSCMTLGSLALMGTPFLAGFYSKDAIIEATNTSHLNACALTMIITATSFTAAYSLRIVYYVQMNTPRYNPIPPLNENNPNQTSPLIQLAIGSTMMGLLLTTITMTKTQVMTMPITTKLSALLVSTLGLFYAMELALYNTKFQHKKHKITYTFSSLLGFFNMLTHRLKPQMNMNLGQLVSLHLNDSLWYETLGPKMISKTHQHLTSTLSHFHKGYIKTYLAIFTLTLTTTLILHQLDHP